MLQRDENDGLKTPATIIYFDFAVAVGGSVVVLQNSLKAVDRQKYAPVVVTALPNQKAQEMFGGLSLPIITHHHWANYVARFAFLEKPIFRSPPRRRLASYLFTLYSVVANLPPVLLLLLRVKRLRPTLIHTHNGFDSMIIGALLGVPTVLHLHGPFGSDSKFEIAIAKMAKACICVSKGIADLLAAKGVPGERLFVLSNPSPVPTLQESAVAAYRNRFNGDGERVLIAHVGRIVAWKGQLQFLQAFALVAERLPNAMALVIGDDIEKLNGDYVDKLHEFVASQGLSDRVIFTGQIGDIHNLVAAVDIVVHSSTEPEPFGLVVTEAMALGKAVVAASYGATAEIVEDNVSGLLADPRDRQALADAILRVAADAELRQRLGLAALAKAEREYSLARYKAGLEGIYEHVLAGES